MQKMNLWKTVVIVSAVFGVVLGISSCEDSTHAGRLDKLNNVEEKLDAKDENVEEKLSDLLETKKSLEEKNTEVSSKIEEIKSKLNITDEDIIAELEKVISEKGNVEKTVNDIKEKLNITDESENKDAVEELVKLLADKKDVEDSYAVLKAELEEKGVKITELEDSNSKKDATISDLENSLTKLKTKYVNPLQFDVSKLSAIAVTKKAVSKARFADEIAEDINLVVIKEDGTVEPAIALATEENAQIIDTPEDSSEVADGEAPDVPEEAEEPEEIFQYVSAENNVIANVLETLQCPYEVNDVEAAGYYIVFDGISHFVYEDGTTKDSGYLIYVTPDGEERDIFANAGVNYLPLNIYFKSYYGRPYMVFDENGNAFFTVKNERNYHSIYRYQPIANRLDDLTPAGMDEIIESFEVSLDGKYIVFAAGKSVKAVKIADKSVKEIYNADNDYEDIPADLVGITNIVYLDKNHSFYFKTSNWTNTKFTEHGKCNAAHSWNYETGVLTTVSYNQQPEFYNNSLWDLKNIKESGVNPDIAEGVGPLITTEEGIFVMHPVNWDNDKAAFTASTLVKITDSEGKFIRPEVPESLENVAFDPPRYNQNVEGINDNDPSTWYTAPYLSNGKGIVVVGDRPKDESHDSVYYYSEGVFKNLLAFDSQARLVIKKLSLSDKSILFYGTDDKGNSYNKSINLEDGSIIDLSINGTVLNMMAVKGSSISKSENTDAVVNCNVTIVNPEDLNVTYTLENNLLKLSVDAGYTKYTWTCNGVVLSTANTLERNVKTWTKGYYPIYVTAVKDGLVYSSFVEVEIK